MRLLERFGTAYRVGDLVMLAVQRELILREHAFDDLTGFVQRAQPPWYGFELDAEAVVLQLVPSGADPKHETPAAQMVQGRRHLRRDAWVAVSVAVDQCADSGAAGLLAQRAQHGPSLQARPGGVGAHDRIEMIEDPQRVVTPSVRLLPQ